jgi:hypothetical protein
MRFPGVAVILAIVGVLLVSSGVAPVGTISPANASPASAAGVRPWPNHGVVPTTTTAGCATPAIGPSRSGNC